MADALTAPYLAQTIDRLLARERRRRRDAQLRRTLMATSLAVLLVAGWRIVDRIYAREPLPVAAAAALVATVFLVGLAFAVAGAVSRSRDAMGREIDRRLGLDDRATAALAVVRQVRTSALGPFVVRDAEESLRRVEHRLDTEFPVRAERRVTAAVRWLARAAVVGIVLAVIAELLQVGGPIKILPGISVGGAEPQELVPPTKDAPRRKGDSPKPADQPEPPPPPDEPEPERKEPRRPAPQGDIRVALSLAKEEFDAGEPIVATVVAAATGEIGAARDFDVRVSVDGPDVDSGVVMRVDPAVPEGRREQIDLGRVPGLKVAPGEHEARARLTTRTTHEEHVSAPVKFRVKPPPKDQKDDDQKKDQPQKKPQPKPQAPKPEPQANEPQPKKDAPDGPGPPPPPPRALERKVVVPLFGQGEEVKKKGLVLVLDPEGGKGGEPERKPAEEAVPAAKRRAEKAVDRAKLSDADRDLVRRYFELLEAALR